MSVNGTTYIELELPEHDSAELLDAVRQASALHGAPQLDHAALIYEVAKRYAESYASDEIRRAFDHGFDMGVRSVEIEDARR